jgi:hypothetical protein
MLRTGYRTPGRKPDRKSVSAVSRRIGSSISLACKLVDKLAESDKMSVADKSVDKVATFDTTTVGMTTVDRQADKMS